MLTKNFVPWVHVRFYFFTPLGDFHLLAASISHFLTAAMKFTCVSSNEIRLLCFESLFFCNPQITEGVNIKNNVEKDTTFVFFFSLWKSRWPCDFLPNKTLNCIWVPYQLIECLWCGRTGNRADVRSRDYQNFLDAWVTKFFYPWCPPRALRVGGGGGQFQATDNATETQNTTLKTYGKLSLFIFLTLY